ncbi:GATA zinc finger domain-containing protein 15-like [Schistocerca americana]|uniref:GATA zinc finger domain-containing protein 15-like n=1 Tax=Schistocerca americana TaxID=7009 RepID=UPI001F4F11C3|nr:GATA zinc finger domain-containing protein 15-like [Schistocerca americana]
MKQISSVNSKVNEVTNNLQTVNSKVVNLETNILVVYIVNGGSSQRHQNNNNNNNNNYGSRSNNNFGNNQNNNRNEQSRNGNISHENNNQENRHHNRQNNYQINRADYDKTFSDFMMMEISEDTSKAENNFNLSTDDLTNLFDENLLSEKDVTESKDHIPKLNYVYVLTGKSSSTSDSDCDVRTCVVEVKVHVGADNVANEYFYAVDADADVQLIPIEVSKILHSCYRKEDEDKLISDKILKLLEENEKSVAKGDYCDSIKFKNNSCKLPLSTLQPKLGNEDQINAYLNYVHSHLFENTDLGVMILAIKFG